MKIKGPWKEAEVRQYLEATVIPARIAVNTPAGAPLVLSLWFLPREDSIWCACNRRARVIELLRRDPRCSFEIASELPPYRGVRGQGKAMLDSTEGPAILGDLLARYRIHSGSKLAVMLNKEAANEVAIRIAPDWITSWDFSARMSDALAPA
jgi:hypothetical protein